MTTILQYLNIKSRLAENWIKSLICPVLLMLMYVCAAHECEFGLHLYPFKEMIPYFFAAGHCNYAINSIVHSVSENDEKLPNSLLDKIMNDEHVVHLKNGLFYGIWSDMVIDITYMKFGKSIQ